MEIIISIWPIKKLGIQQGYTLDAKPRSQLVQIPTPHLPAWVTEGSQSKSPLFFSCCWTWMEVPDSHGKSSGSRGAAKLCTAESLSKTRHCWNILCSRAVLELQRSSLMFSIVLTEWPRRELHEAYVTSSLVWVSLTCNNAGVMVRSKLPLLSPSAKQVHPKDNSEAWNMFWMLFSASTSHQMLLLHLA